MYTTTAILLLLLITVRARRFKGLCKRFFHLGKCTAEEFFGPGLRVNKTVSDGGGGGVLRGIFFLRLTNFYFLRSRRMIPFRISIKLVG